MEVFELMTHKLLEEAFAIFLWELTRASNVKLLIKKHSNNMYILLITIYIYLLFKYHWLYYNQSTFVSISL